MAKRYPLEILISATDKASAVLNRVADRVERFNAPFRRLNRALGDFADKTGISRVGTALKNVGTEALAVGRRVALGLGAATAAIGAFAFTQIKAADAIGDTAARLNISTRALQAYQFGFQQADVDQQAFIASLDTLNKNLGEAKIGIGKALPLFRGLALDPKQFRTIDELLPALADRLSRITDPLKRAAIANKLLGQAGAQMALKLAEGPGALREMEAAARAAGAVIDGDVIESAGRLDTLLGSLRMTLAGVAGNALGRLYPAMIKIGAAIQAAIIDHMPQIMAFADQFAANLPGYIDRARDAFNALRGAVEPVWRLFSFLSEKIGTGNTVLATLAVIIGGKLLLALGSLGIALAQLGVNLSVAFGVPGLIVAAVATAVAAGWWLYKNWDAVWIKIVDGVGWVVEKFRTAWDSIKSAAVAAFEGIKTALELAFKSSPLYPLFKGLSWIAGKAFGPSQAAPIASAPAVGGALLQPGPRQQVEVKVDLSNLPPGTRTRARASDGLALDLSRGFAMPGVAY